MAQPVPGIKTVCSELRQDQAYFLLKPVLKGFKDSQMEDQAYKLDDLWPISENDSIYHRATLQIIYWEACLLTET